MLSNGLFQPEADLLSSEVRGPALCRPDLREEDFIDDRDMATTAATEPQGKRVEDKKATIGI